MLSKTSTPSLAQSNGAVAVTDPLVRLQGVGKDYMEAGERHVILHDANLDLHAGEFTVLLGRSGSGKSTLLNLISGIDDLSRGVIWINDIPVTRLPEQQRTLFRRQHIGFVFQFFNLIPTLTVQENILLTLELNNWPASQALARVRDLMTRVGLANRAHTYPDRLSGGEQQRVAIARALAPNPTLILADEPTGNLDEDTGRSVLSLLLELTRQAGRTLIMATHSMEVASQADRVFRIVHGQLIPAPELPAAMRGRRE